MALRQTSNPPDTMPAEGNSAKARRLANQQARRKKHADKKKAGGAAGGGTSTDHTGSPVPEDTNAWIKDTLSGRASSLSEYDDLISKDNLDPSKNPALQGVIDSIDRHAQQDYLGDLRANQEGAEGQGMFGSGMYTAMNTNISQRSRESVDDAVSRLLAGHYENAQNRRADLTKALMQQQGVAANVDIEDKASQRQTRVGMANARVGMANVNLGRQQFAWQKEMDIDSKQQDALNDYYNLIAGIGAMGGSQWGTGNTGNTAMNPWSAALIGAGGSLMDSYGKGQFGVNNGNTSAPSARSCPARTVRPCSSRWRCWVSRP